MIVYNVNRMWFSEKEEAEVYRKSQGLKPAATQKIAVNNREELAALLNSLCSPAEKAKAVTISGRDITAIVDRAYVEPSRDIPLYIPAFLLADPDARERQKARLAAIPLDQLDAELRKE